ncbi:SUN domain-containing protein 3 [Marasmius sp. AFHP31]|nr:SUN domain-containing protein 3 [Marasmius sp. AFHP31]
MGLLDDLSYLVHGFYHHHAHIVPPLAVIDSVIQIGRCWTFSGSTGHIGIALADPIVVTHVVLHHPDHRELSHGLLAQSPSQLTLWSLLPSNAASVGLLEVVSGKKFTSPKNQRSPGDFVHLGNFTYDATSEPQRTVFEVSSEFVSSLVVVEIAENRGSDRTCLYRISIHGIRG